MMKFENDFISLWKGEIYQFLFYNHDLSVDQMEKVKYIWLKTYRE